MKILALGTLCAGQKTFQNALLKAGYKVGVYDLDLTSICETPDGAIITVDRLPQDLTKGVEVLIHLVRNPLTAIPMIRKELGGKTTLMQAANVWYWRNIQIGYRASQIVKIENLRETWPKQLLRPKSFVRIRTEIRPMTWRALYNLLDDKRRAGVEILELATKYGYRFMQENK